MSSSSSSSSSHKQQQRVAMKDLAEEGKKRIVILLICLIGLSYLMSLTSSSVWDNLPAAAALIILLRYFTLDFEMKKKAASYNSKPPSANTLSQKKPLLYPKRADPSEWKKKVNSPVVEDAINRFTRHLVSEWVTDLWYSRLTPDKEGPEELEQIVNGVLGEISARMRNVNLIDLLTRDLITIMCNNLELFRTTQAKLDKQQLSLLSTEHRDMEHKCVLASENKLHPALFSAESEHKVLQAIMDGLISFTLRPEDLQCSFFRYIARELLACAVIRPVINLANPRFINERIEAAVIARTKGNNEGSKSAQESSPSKSSGSLRVSPDHFSKSLDPTATGVELVQFKSEKSKTPSVKVEIEKDPLLSIDTRSSRSWSSLPENSEANDDIGIQRHRSGGEWGDMLDRFSHRKTEALAPEHFENMWTKGRDYKKKDWENRLVEQVQQHAVAEKPAISNHSKVISKATDKQDVTKPPSNQTVQNLFRSSGQKVFNGSVTEEKPMKLEDFESESSDFSISEDEEPDSVTGLDSPFTKVWDGRNNRNTAVSRIHHPLENLEPHNRKKTGRVKVHQQIPMSHSGRKRSRLSSQKVPIWQEVERTSFLSGDGLDILSPAKRNEKKLDDSSDDSETEILDRLHSGATACSSAPWLTLRESHSLVANSLKSSLMGDSFFKLRCEVFGANIVKSDSKTFAVYSISVTDVNNNSWSVKRRFRHFEELHRRLKEFPEYDLHLPPKQFLSTGLDVSVIRERCIRLDRYLKKLLQLPRISGSIEVWDFLSVDSQTYLFSSSFSIVQTLSADLDNHSSEKSKQVPYVAGLGVTPLPARRKVGIETKESRLNVKPGPLGNNMRSNSIDMSHSPVKNQPKKLFNTSGDHDINTRSEKNLPCKVSGKVSEDKVNDGVEDRTELFVDAASDPTFPTEWVPPNLSIPILDLVDVIFQLQDGGWIRRQAFWVAKQILQLGMGDAFDDWLIEKIQLLRKGPMVASAIERVEQILWPDGIFITKHPNRKPRPQSPSPVSPSGPQPAASSSPRLSEEQQQEADRRAKFVYELMIEKAPATIVGLVGRKEYEQCAKDLYFFLQSSVCMKLLAYDLLELLLLSAFPEMDYVFKQLHDEKDRFGEFREN
ncbi:hypothetical protein ACFE04_008514 [Oxalis oulophora]